MELTKEQIQRVESYLDIKYINYIDVRIEVLDHILLDIEKHLIKNLSFDDALKVTILKWNHILESTSSVYLGYAYVKPKPIIEKMKTNIKHYAFTMWILFLLSMVSIVFLKLEINLNTSKILSQYGKILIYSSTALVLLGYSFIYKSKEKTSYRFLYESQVLPSVLFSIIFTGTIINSDGNLETLNTMMILYSLLSVPFGIKLYKKHFSAIKKYSHK